MQPWAQLHHHGGRQLLSLSWPGALAALSFSDSSVLCKSPLAAQVPAEPSAALTFPGPLCAPLIHRGCYTNACAVQPCPCILPGISAVLCAKASMNAQECSPSFEFCCVLVGSVWWHFLRKIHLFHKYLLNGTLCVRHCASPGRIKYFPGRTQRLMSGQYKWLECGVRSIMIRSQETKGGYN